MELLMKQDQGRLVNVGVNRLHISSYYHPANTQRLLEAITIVVILDQELLRVHGVSLLILTLDGNIVMCESVVSIFITKCLKNTSLSGNIVILMIFIPIYHFCEF